MSKLEHDENVLLLYEVVILTINTKLTENFLIHSALFLQCMLTTLLQVPIFSSVEAPDSGWSVAVFKWLGSQTCIICATRYAYTCNQLHVQYTCAIVEFLYKNIPEMRTPPLVGTHCMVTATYMIIKKCKNILPEIRVPSDIDSPWLSDTLSCPKGVWNREGLCV